MEMGKQKDRSSHQHDTHLDPNKIKFLIKINSFKTEKKRSSLYRGELAVHSMERSTRKGNFFLRIQKSNNTRWDCVEKRAVMSRMLALLRKAH
jgi:hypothetical protein